jgi:RHS repeat-associated protein
MDSAASQPLWCRVESNGSSVTVKTVNSSSAPSEGTWSSTSACISSSGFTFKGGLLGFCANGYGYIDNLTIKSWNTATSAFDITEHVDEFTTNGSNYAEETIDYDRNGNLTYDGVQKYSYDAWNRMVAIAHAYRSSGTVSAGQSSVTMKYDGKGRRIQKAIANTGAWDCTYKYYYDGDSCIEERNGSDITFKKMVWGTNYIDELVQLKLCNGDCDTLDDLIVLDLNSYWICQDANYNVLGMVDETGALIERYEYSPYGQRKTFSSAGANDVGCYAPTLASRRGVAWNYALGDGPWAKNEFGHQGLMHDEEVDLVYNRARALHPGLGRFVQRDPIPARGLHGKYSYASCAPNRERDPSGLVVIIVSLPRDYRPCPVNCDVPTAPENPGEATPCDMDKHTAPSCDGGCKNALKTAKDSPAVRRILDQIRSAGGKEPEIECRRCFGPCAGVAAIARAGRIVVCDHPGAGWGPTEMDDDLAHELMHVLQFSRGDPDESCVDRMKMELEAYLAEPGAKSKEDILAYAMQGAVASSCGQGRCKPSDINDFLALWMWYHYQHLTGN